MEMDYLKNVRQQFDYYKKLGDKTFSQLKDEQFFWLPSGNSNSIATIVKHLHGNMLSRWTDFLTTDGEKVWRKRDEEFENNLSQPDEIKGLWQEGWNCLFNALDNLNGEDLNRVIYIRGEAHTVMEAINRQLAHYPYHVGQIIYIAKILVDQKWNSLSIPQGNSQLYNIEMMTATKKS